MQKLTGRPQIYCGPECRRMADRRRTFERRRAAQPVAVVPDPPAAPAAADVQALRRLISTVDDKLGALRDRAQKLRTVPMNDPQMLRVQTGKLAEEIPSLPT